MKQKAFVVDLDGTIMNGEGRLHLRPPIEDTDIPHAWDAFNMACGDDEPLWDTIALVNAMRDAGYVPLFVTGRREVARENSNIWFRRIFEWFDPSTVFIMRAMEDTRRPTECKIPTIAKLAEEYDIIFAIDDDPMVIKGIRSLGIPAYQVRDWQENQ